MLSGYDNCTSSDNCTSCVSGWSCERSGASEASGISLSGISWGGVLSGVSRGYWSRVCCGCWSCVCCGCWSRIGVSCWSCVSRGNWSGHHRVRRNELGGGRKSWDQRLDNSLNDWLWRWCWCWLGSCFFGWLLLWLLATQEGCNGATFAEAEADCQKNPQPDVHVGAGGARLPKS
jgi:hypothetical protein